MGNGKAPERSSIRLLLVFRAVPQVNKSAEELWEKDRADFDHIENPLTSDGDDNVRVA